MNWKNAKDKLPTNRQICLVRWFGVCPRSERDHKERHAIAQFIIDGDNKYFFLERPFDEFVSGWDSRINLLDIQDWKPYELD